MPERPPNANGTMRLAARPASASVLLAGDLCPIGRLDPMLSAGRIEAAFGDCLPLFQRAETAVVNLEAPLCRADQPIAKDGPNFRADPLVAAALARAGVNVACLANNHILDQGPEGLAQTIAALDEAGVRHVGAGLTEPDAAAPLVLSAGPLKLALIGLAEAEFARSPSGGAAGLDPLANALAVGQAARLADVVIVLLHGGNEQVLFPSPLMQRRCRQLIDAGAAAVICHHPHVPQGIEMYQGRPIAYSLGNFLFDWPEPEPETDSGFLLRLGLDSQGVCELEAIPFRKSANGGAELLAGPSRTAYLALINELSEPLTDAKRMGRLWRQQCVGLYESRYRPKLRRMAALASSDRPTDRRDVLVAFNVFQCQAHAEAMQTILGMMVEGPLTPLEPEAGMLAAWMDRLKSFARPTRC